MELFKSTHFWEAVAFVIAIGGLWFFAKVGKVITGLLDDQIDKVKVSLDETESLRSEANEAVAKYRRKQQEVEHEAQQMLETAKSNIENYRGRAKEKLTNSMEARKREISLRIEFAQKRTEQEIQELATEVVISSAKQAMLSGLTSLDNDNLIISGINEVAPAIEQVQRASA